MPTVRVNGDLEGAISEFKRRCNKEGILLQSKKAEAFIPDSEQRRWKEHRREKKTAYKKRRGKA